MFLGQIPQGLTASNGSPVVHGLVAIIARMLSDMGLGTRLISSGGTAGRNNTHTGDNDEMATTMRHFHQCHPMNRHMEI